MFAIVTDSLQPVSNTLYARHGMLPREALLGLGGAPRLTACAEPRSSGRAGVPASLDPEPLRPASVPDLCAIDTGVMDIDRAVDHAFYLGEGGRPGWLFRRAGRPVAYAMCRANGIVGPLACLDSADVAPVLRHALTDLVAHGVEKAGGQLAGLLRGGPAGALGRRSGLCRPPEWLLLASRPIGRLDRYVSARYSMF